MKIILLKDYINLGKKNDIVDVANGYAMNFLIPKKIAIFANNKNLYDLEQAIKIEKTKNSEEIEKLKKISKKIENKNYFFTVIFDEKTKKISSGVSKKQIREAIFNSLTIEEMDVVKKISKIDIPEISQIKKYEVIVHFKHSIKSKIVLDINNGTKENKK